MQADRMCFAPAPGGTPGRRASRWHGAALLGLVLALPAVQAQSPAANPQETAAQARTGVQSSLSNEEQTGGGQRWESAHLEDAGSRIDELRYGGETRQVLVQPKANVPGYEIRPVDGSRRAHTQDSSGSPRVWNLVRF